MCFLFRENPSLGPALPYSFAVLHGQRVLFITRDPYTRILHGEKFEKSMSRCEIVHLVEFKLKLILRIKKNKEREKSQTWNFIK